MQLFVTYIVLFVTAVKARFSDFLFFHCGPYLCLDRSPIAHNLVVCTWTSGQVDAAACLSVVGSQTIFPALFALMHKGRARAVSFDYSPALFKI